MSRWLRINEDCIDNPKILKLPADLRWQWLALLCVASKNDGVLPPIDDVALCLRVPEAKAAEYITRLVKAQLIDKQGEVFVPHNWNKRQYKSDVSTDRVKRHRETKRNVSSTVTPNVSGGVSETVTETAPEAEAEPDTQQSRADASAPIDEDLKKKATALKAGIGAMFQSRGWTEPNLERASFWLAQGYAAGTVLGAIEGVLKRGKPISTADYFDGAIKDAHAKAPMPSLQIVSKKVFVIHGTQAWGCWQQVSPGGRGWPVRQRENERGVLQDGWDFETEYPPGYDEATGERISPTDSDEAAA